MACAAESGRGLGGGQAVGASSCRAGWCPAPCLRVGVLEICEDVHGCYNDWELGGEHQGCGILCNELGNPIE